MTKLMRLFTIWTVMMCTAYAWCAPAGQYIGYVYPAGGRQGTVVRVTVAGQRLGGVHTAYISGQGVNATILEYIGPNGPLNPLQQEELWRRLKELDEKRRNAAQPPKTAEAMPTITTPAMPEPPKVTLPDLPDLRNLEQLTPNQIRQVIDKYLNRQRRPKPPIAEEVTLDVTIAPDAAPGDRELRLQTPAGLTNPLIFQVGTLAEIREKDRTDPDAVAPPTSETPVVLNGQIMPGEEDRFALTLRGGQRLAIQAHARYLIPYLADAVPGWFQTVLALYDANGKEIAYADDRGFDPDPLLYVQVPADGDYVLEIRDAIYRGREDFVYRVIVEDAKAGLSMFPFQNPDDFPQLAALTKRDEIEPNNTLPTAQPCEPAQYLRGRIGQPGDLDLFRYTGKAGDEIVAEVYARRLGSPLDALVRVLDVGGHVLAWNDDCERGEVGLQTHHADSYVTTTLPADGVVYVQVTDIQRHGGDDYQYYLRVGPKQPDFVLRMTPSSISISAGGSTAITITAFRKDGWDGEIEVVLKDAPDGFTLGNARIPAGKSEAKLTLTAPRQPLAQPISLHLEGRAQIGEATITRPVVPAEKMMQAFALNHLVPAQEFLVVIIRGRN